MAYITKEAVAVIRKDLKEAFPQFKFSVSKDASSSSVNVAIMAGPLDFTHKRIINYDDKETKKIFKDYFVINHYHLDSSTYHSEENKKMLQKVSEIIHKKHWDKSDIMSDYFNCAFYVKLSVGKYNKPYVQIN